MKKLVKFIEENKETAAIIAVIIGGLFAIATALITGYFNLEVAKIVLIGL